MTYDLCQKRVKDAISLLEGVDSVGVNLEAKRAIVSLTLKKLV